MPTSAPLELRQDLPVVPPPAPKAPDPVPVASVALPPAPAPLDLPQPGMTDSLLLDWLRDRGRLPLMEIAGARAAHLRRGVPVIDLLSASGEIRRDDLLDELALASGADFHGGPLVAHPDLVDRLGLSTCLARNLAPLARAGGCVVLATGRPAETLRHARMIRARIGRFRMVLAAPETVERAVLRVRHGRATDRAHGRIATEASCRRWLRSRIKYPGLAALAGLACAAVAAPGPTLAVFTLVSLALLLAITALKVAAIATALRRPDAENPAFARPHRPAPLTGQPPMVSLLVPLLREEEIAERLVRRLTTLTYPRERLEICLILEEHDGLTRKALAATELPPHMRVVEVPAGPVRTKPRALNYALAQARGEIVGVYDAEDAPDPDQIETVVARFAEEPPEVVCLQGALDFYNPRDTLLTRLFTLEYAGWFRLMLPGLDRLGLVLPLGGTTLFFRRRALERIGGWDAWNVTEDADLGIRLALHGWRTAILPSTTREEATARLVPWVRQRSRWLKGYGMTWATHMRHPRDLLARLGWRRFLGIQALFLGTFLQALIAPVLWSFWLLLFGVPHPLVPILGQGGILVLMVIFLTAEAVNLAAGLVALRATGHRGLGRYVPLLHPYCWLGTFAAWKAAVETVLAPFYWDKTRHGTSRTKN